MDCVMVKERLEQPMRIKSRQQGNLLSDDDCLGKAASWREVSRKACVKGSCAPKKVQK
jgi:hypothetical protein